MIKRLLPLLLLLPGLAHAAITFVGGAENSSDGANTTNLTVTLPTHATDDVGVCAHHHDDGGAGVPEASLITATGWTQIVDSLNHLSGSDRVLDIWYKKFTSASETNPVFSTDTSDNRAVVCLVFRGVDTTTQIDVTTTTADGGANNDNPDHVDITTANDNAALVLFLNATQHGLTAAGAPSGYTISTTSDFAEDDEIMLSAYLLDAGTAGAKTPGVWTNTGGTGSADTTTATVALRAATGSGPSFTSGPTVAAATNGYTISGTVTGSGTLTVYAVGCAPSESAPTANQIETGDCGSGADAILSANEVWTTGVANDFLLTAAGKIPRMDVYVSASDGTNDTAVSTFADEDRSANSGKTLTALTSVSANSFLVNPTDAACDTDGSTAVLTGCADTSDFKVGMLVDLSAGFADLTDVRVIAKTASTLTLENNSNSLQTNITVTADDYVDPDAAIGDVIEGSTTASCSAGTDAITWAADGTFSYTATNCGSTLTSVDYCIEDVSATSGLTTTPGDCFTTYDTYYLFNTAPDFDMVDGDEILIWDLNVALSGMDFANYCDDVDLHTLTFTTRSGTFPTGTSMAATGVVSGTPTVENEAGTVVDIQCADVGNLTDSQSFTIYVIDTWTMPDCTTADTITECETQVDAVAPWYNGVSISESGRQSSLTVAKDDIISHAPAAGEVNDPLAAISAEVSSGPPAGINSMGYWCPVNLLACRR